MRIPLKRSKCKESARQRTFFSILFLFSFSSLVKNSVCVCVLVWDTAVRERFIDTWKTFSHSLTQRQSGYSLTHHLSHISPIRNNKKKNKKARKAAALGTFFKLRLCCVLVVLPALWQRRRRCFCGCCWCCCCCCGCGGGFCVCVRSVQRASFILVGKYKYKYARQSA